MPLQHLSPLRMRFTLALIVTLLVSACGGKSEDSQGPQVDPGDFDDLRPYKTNSPYADVIVECAIAESVSESCDLATLPLIGMKNENPSIDDILDRLVISHIWMGTRFEELLHILPEEMLPIFRAVTAVVIDDDIRPAYYTTATGAIYLDPAYMWLMASEASTINRKEDFRAGFSDPLAFRSVGRFVKNNQYAYRFTSLENASARRLEDIELAMARLLLHELAHANDNFPPGTYTQLNPNAKIAHAAGARSSIGISQRLTAQDPLSSDLMFSLADVMYRGKDPSATDLATSGAEAGAAFEVDTAADDYGYTSQFEDVAMLFEVTMMKYFYDVDYEVAYTTAPTGDTRDCADYPVEWGVRHRIGDSQVSSRAQFVVNQIYPDIDLTEFLAQLPMPLDLGADLDWCQAIYIPDVSDEQQGTNTKTSAANRLPNSTSELGLIPEDDITRPYH